MERVQHREHGGHADARAHQHDRPAALVEREPATWRRDVDAAADVDRGAEVPAGRSVRLDLDRDPVASAVGWSRQRVAAHQWRPAVAGCELERDELPRKGARQRSAVVGFELQRQHGGALRVLRDHPQGSEARPRRWRSPERQALVPTACRAAALLLEQRAHRGLPARTERGDPQRSLKQLGVGARVHVQQRVDRRDRHPTKACGHLDDLVAGLDGTLVTNSEVEAGTAVAGEQRGHARLVHADSEPVARHPRLRDLEQGGADAVLVADAHLVVTEPVHREVLTELAEDEIVALQLIAPVAVRVELIDVHGTMLTSVPGAIALAVPVDIQPSDPARTRYCLFPDPREDGPPPPADLARHPDVDRHQSRATPCHPNRAPLPGDGHTGQAPE